MYCPNCGAKNNNEQKFCRFCGLNIETTIKSLQTELAKNDKTNNFQLLKWSKRIISYGTMFSASLVGVIVIGNYFEWWQIGREISRIPLFFYLGFLLINWVIGSFQKKNNQAEISTNFETDKLRTKTPETNNLLEEKPFEPIPSVTDDSTELLMVENKTRKLN